MKFHYYLEKLGLKFHDLTLEKSYLIFKAEEDHNVFLYQNIVFSVSAVIQVILNFFIDNENPYDYALAGSTILALLLRNKIPILHKIFFSLYPLVMIYFVTTVTIKTTLPYPVIYNYMMGNFVGLLEALVFFSVKQVFIRIFWVCSSFAARIIPLRENLHFDDSLVWISIMPIIFILSILYRDNLERKSFRMIYEAKQRLEKFQTLLSRDFPSNVIITDLFFTSILYSNQSFAKIFEPEIQNSLSFLFKWFKVESLLKPSSSNLVGHNETLADFVSKLSSDPALMRIDEVFILSATFDYKEENPQYYEIRLRKILWEGKPCYTIILNDTSDKHMITALKYADEQKDRVIATVSHELRTPINGILGLLEMIGVKVEDITTQTYVQHCKNCSKLLLYLVNSILDLNLLRKNKLHIAKEIFSLDGLLEEMKSLYLFQTKQKGIDLVIKKADSTPGEIYTDKFRLIEILINLLSNALKFTFKGSITLFVGIDSEHPHKVIFKVIDTGLGIKEEDKPKLFQMFGKIKHEDKNINSSGVGLGLTIANSLVKALNEDDRERIQLESQYQKGSVFTFRVPSKKSSKEERISKSFIDRDVDLKIIVSEESSVEIQEMLPGEGSISMKVKNFSNRSASLLMSPPLDTRAEKYTNYRIPQNFNFPSKDTGLSLEAKQSRSVLIVDDNPFNLLTASFLLEKYGLNVVKATSGEQCIQLLKKSFEEDKPFKLILMDIQMPVQDGIETTKIICSKIKIGELYNVPIVALTANKIGDKELKIYKESGMINAVEKPLKEEILRPILKTFVRP